MWLTVRGCPGPRSERIEASADDGALRLSASLGAAAGVLLNYVLLDWPDVKIKIIVSYGC